MPKRSVSPVDQHVAARLRAARLTAGLSQQDAAELFGVSFQQIQKYEKASNRISIGALFVLADLYQQPVSYFLVGAPGATATHARPDVGTLMVATAKGNELAQAFLAIDDPGNRSLIVHLTQVLARAPVQQFQAAE